MKLGSASRRLHVGFAAVAVIVLVLGGRLLQLQGLDSKTYASASEKMRLRTVSLDAQRGKIIDADGNVLAYSVDAKAITADPTQVKDPFATAQQLAPILGVSASGLQQSLSKTCATKANPAAKCRFAYLARGVDPALADRIIKLGLAGVYQQSEPQRQHPGRTIGANIVGFTDRTGRGMAGIEKQYDGVLQGTPGTMTYEQGANGEIIPSGLHKETDAKPGGSVQLTIDEDLQYVTQRALESAVKGAAARSGQVTVLDAKTGQVMAMASTGTYDAQNPGAAKPSTLGNPNVSSVFEPGSVNKVVAFTAALDRGLITPYTKFNVPGELPYADVIIHDDWVHSPVDWTATGILAKSSNVGTLMIAKKVGRHVLDELRQEVRRGRTHRCRPAGREPGDPAGPVDLVGQHLRQPADRAGRRPHQPADGEHLPGHRQQRGPDPAADRLQGDEPRTVRRPRRPRRPRSGS